MTKFRFQPLCPLIFICTIMLSACGGGGSVSETPEPAVGSALPATGAGSTDSAGTNAAGNSTEGVGVGSAGADNTDAESTDEESTPIAPTVTTLSGRVADGYIKGALICIDVNENTACDADEPQTTSADGGTYSLDLTPEQMDKPILAEVPAEAIDEDTGVAIGREMVLSAPADRPAFISPLTTLVHEELRENPSLAIGDAEANLREALGVVDADEASLFEDYVAHGQDDSGEFREQYRYLHQTARVVAGMMGEIRASVRESAIESGIDIEGDPQARRALRQLVRSEVRALIPEIAAAVSNQIVEMDMAQTDEMQGVPQGNASSVGQFNPNTIIEELVPTSMVENAADRIETLIDEQPFKTADMQSLLGQGIYLLDIDCDYRDGEPVPTDRDDGPIELDPQDGSEGSVQLGVTAMLNDEGEIELQELPESCFASYTYVASQENSDSLISDEYIFDPETGSWELMQQDDESMHHALVLQNGEWSPLLDDGPETIVEYADDGSVVLDTGDGRMVVQASGRSLEAAPIMHHLRSRGAGGALLGQVEPEALFAADSWVYRLYVKRQMKRYVIFNWAAHDDVDDADRCAEFGGNCNLIDIKDDQGLLPVTTLASLQEASLSGVTINEAFFDHSEGRPVDLFLLAEENAGPDLPTHGQVKWVIPNDRGPEDPPHDLPPVENCPEILPPAAALPGDSVGDVAQAVSASDQQAGVSQPLSIEPVCIDYDFGVIAEIERIEDSEDKSPDEDADAFDVNEETPYHVIARSKWWLKEVQGVAMMKIELPIVIRQRMDQREFAYMLLAEHDGFVRRGAKLSESRVDDELGYNVNAFEALAPVLESYVTQSMQ